MISSMGVRDGFGGDARVDSVFEALILRIEDGEKVVRRVITVAVRRKRSMNPTF